MISRMLAVGTLTGMVGAVLLWAQQMNRRARAEAQLWADVTDAIG